MSDKLPRLPGKSLYCSGHHTCNALNHMLLGLVELVELVDLLVMSELLVLLVWLISPVSYIAYYV